MAELKYSRKADKIGNLYRSALYMAQGNVDIALQFLKKGLHNKLDQLSKDQLTTEKDQKYWAEKILDQYIKQKTHY